ncbi:MAG: hypothetical protein Q9180_006441, partial [Flavoplaca navasiana]
EWLEVKLVEVHKKWSASRQQVASQQLQGAIKDVQQKDTSMVGADKTSHPSRAAAWLYGRGGVVEKLQRDIFNAGCAKLQVDGGTTENAHKEPRDPTPPTEYLHEGDEKLYADKPYRIGDADDECEEDASSDKEEIEAIVAAMPDSYDSPEESEDEDEEEDEDEDEDENEDKDKDKDKDKDEDKDKEDMIEINNP